MKLALADPKYLRDSISIISDLVTEAIFKITPTAIELIAMDPANVAMVIFKLFSTSFTEYDVNENVNLGINLNNLKQILRRARPEDTVSLEINSDNSLKIQLKSNTVRTFSIPIIDLEEKEQKIPELKFPLRIDIPSSVFNDAVEDADIVAESVALIGEPKRFTLLAEGDLSKASIDIMPDGNHKISCEATEKVKSKYSLEYLKKMITASKLVEKVAIRFGNDYPLKLDYTITDKLQLSFILAPRVEND